MLSSVANKKYGIFLLVGALFLLFASTFSHSILTWDDIEYLTNNPAIRDLSVAGIIDLWQHKVMNLRHPLVFLSFAIEYHFVGLKPRLYHIDNVLLHLINVWLVFKCISMLTGNKEWAFITALLFGLHPMHVESIAWISARKDLLFTLFFLSSLILYLSYLNKATSKIWFYILALTCFCFSLLAKAQAAPLPLILILMDWYIKRDKGTLKYLDKIPFFVLAFLFGIFTLLSIDRSTNPYIIDATFFDRLALSGHALLYYLGRAIVPIYQAAIYPFSELGFTPYPMGAYMALLISIAVVIFIFYKYRRNRLVMFGALFFILNIALMLHLVIPNSSLVYDRFTYVPYIGLFLIIGYIYQQWKPAENENWHFKFKLAGYGLGLWILFLVYQTYERTKVWSSDLALWTDVIQKYPNTSRAYSNRGDVYRTQNNLGEAMLDYNHALHIDPTKTNVLNNRGIVHKALKDYNAAMTDFNMAILIDPEYSKAYYNRGNLFINLLKNDEAMTNFNNAISLKPDYAEALDNRGYLYAVLGNFDKALKDFDLALHYDPELIGAYYNRGLLYYKQGAYKKAIKDYSQALTIDLNYTKALYQRAFCYFKLNNMRQALDDVLQAKAKGHKVDEVFIQQIRDAL